MSTCNGQPLCGKFVDHERDECIIDLYARVQALEASVDESKKATSTPAERHTVLPSCKLKCYHSTKLRKTS